VLDHFLQRNVDHKGGRFGSTSHSDNCDHLRDTGVSERHANDSFLLLTLSARRTFPVSQPPIGILDLPSRVILTRSITITSNVHLNPRVPCNHTRTLPLQHPSPTERSQVSRGRRPHRAGHPASHGQGLGCRRRGLCK
jgi:hypothetical protein